ncbi:F1 complex, delta/epsilon subunit of ATPase [Hyaloraphidium curvatum]|nr:F1 complex, delta/epsilon subunit of ATPase [Hyaloraphidium curvatum]
MLRFAPRLLVSARPAVSRAAPRAARAYATEAAPAPPAGEKGKLTLNFVAPHQTFYSRTVVQQVNLTTSDGDIGILADHVPIVEQLVPGVVEVVFDAGKSEKLFVSGGFLAVNPDSTCNITAVEAVPLEQIDFEAAKRGLEEAQRKLSSSSSEEDKAVAQIEIDTYTALVGAATK